MLIPYARNSRYSTSGIVSRHPDGLNQVFLLYNLAFNPCISDEFSRELLHVLLLVEQFPFWKLLPLC